VSSPPPVTLTLDDGHGNREDIVLTGPGGTIRAAIGEPGCHSGIWRIWANKNKSDVYIAIRNIAGYQKWSLHETGDWRYQWVTTERAQQYAKTSERVIDNWAQPQEVGESRLTKGFTKKVRHEDLVPLADIPGSLPAEVVWLPAPPEGHAMGMHVAIMRPDGPQIELQDAVPFAGFTLSDGRAVLLFASRQPVTDAQNQMIEDAVAKVLARKPAHVHLRAEEGLRMSAFGNDLEGGKQVWDIALRLPDE
jgi:hypothetical protein